MAREDDAVREAAAKLQEAVSVARLAGYRIEWPSTPDGLSAIAISETGKVKPVETAKPAEKPTTFGGGPTKL